MKKIFFLLLLLPQFFFSQSTIPYAAQQPKWFIAIYVQDKTGAVDTTYYAYDPAASAWMDNNFGEYWMLDKHQVAIVY